MLTVVTDLSARLPAAGMAQSPVNVLRRGASQRRLCRGDDLLLAVGPVRQIIHGLAGDCAGWIRLVRTARGRCPWRVGLGVEFGLEVGRRDFCAELMLYVVIGHVSVSLDPGEGKRGGYELGRTYAVFAERTCGSNRGLELALVGVGD